MSNLKEARSLIEADLMHARHVADLWTRQVSELEKALEQIDAVGTSRSALQVEYQGTKGTGAVLDAPVSIKDVPRRGRKPKNALNGTKASTRAQRTDITSKRSSKLAERSTVQAAKAEDGRRGRTAKTAAKKKSGRAVGAKYKDPNSDKTWTGHGRPPAWLQGDRQQYEIGARGNVSAAAGTDSAAATGDAQNAAAV